MGKTSALYRQQCLMLLRRKTELIRFFRAELPEPADTVTQVGECFVVALAEAFLMNRCRAANR
jgi:hypothetical protein